MFFLYVFQPSCPGRSDYVHLGATGNGSFKWPVGGRRCPGSDQTGDQLKNKISKIKKQIKKHIWKFFLQALVNMGEILKAAGCGYDNGKEKPNNNLT